jgi:LysR family transcriptional regulator, low CO2-responsive transcriptional regulator
MLSLSQLRTFLAVVDTGSVGGAAEQLAVSQPAVSAALASLSEALGAAIVERDGRRTRITAAGEALAVHARRIFSTLDRAREDVVCAAEREARRARIATVTTVAEHVIARLLHGFRQQEPDVDVELFVANRDHVWDRLRHWEADLVVGGRPPRDPVFCTLAVRANELLLVRAPEYGADYARATWLLREPGSGTRAATQALFTSIGIDPPTLTIGSNSAIRECVRAGLGVSLLSRDTVERELASGTLVVVDAPATPLVRNWHLVGLSDRQLSAGAAKFAQYAIQTQTFEVYSRT